MSAVRFSRIAVVGLGLLGGSVARGVHAHLPAAVTLGFDADPAVRARAREISLADEVPETIDEAVAGADLVVLCVPVGAMEAAGRAIAPHLAAGVVVTDVGSSKASVARALADHHRSMDNTVYLPLASRAGFGTALLDATTAQPVAFLPLDSF